MRLTILAATTYTSSVLIADFISIPCNLDHFSNAGLGSPCASRPLHVEKGGHILAALAFIILQ